MIPRILVLFLFAELDDEAEKIRALTDLRARFGKMNRRMSTIGHIVDGPPSDSESQLHSQFHMQQNSSGGLNSGAHTHFGRAQQFHADHGLAAFDEREEDNVSGDEVEHEHTQDPEHEDAKECDGSGFESAKNSSPVIVENLEHSIPHLTFPQRAFSAPLVSASAVHATHTSNANVNTNMNPAAAAFRAHGRRPRHRARQTRRRTKTTTTQPPFHRTPNRTWRTRARTT